MPTVHPAGPRHADQYREPVSGPAADLDPAIWPLTAERVDGAVSIGGASVRDLTERHGTPLMLLDEADVRHRATTYAEAFAGGEVYYAGKAFLCTTMARWVDEAGLNLDVCSGGELALALRAGTDPARIALHGNNKSTDELERAVVAGVGHVVVDSLDEIHRLDAIARAHDVRQKVLIRVTVGVEAHTHEFIATAHEDQKFGLSLAGGAADAAVAQVLAHDALELIGLHSHIGSQIFDTGGFEVAARRVVELLVRIRDEHGLQLPEIDLGGGFGIAYVDGDAPQPVKETAARLMRIVETECTANDLRVPRLSIEPGRGIVGQAGITVYRVGTVKPVVLEGGQTRLYVSVDGGMSDNIRTALYDADYTAVIADRVSDAEPVRARVVGKHCESGDIVVRDAWLPGDVSTGDLIAVAATGAYCRALASNYNHVPRPPVVAVRDGLDSVLLRRETEDDLFALDPGWTSTEAGS